MAVDGDYHTFLRRRLPELRRHRLPFYRRTRKTKHDTLRACLRRTRLERGDLVVEFGVYRGTTIRLMSRAFPDQRVFGFDSFEGFPDDGRKDWQQSFQLGGELPEVPGNVTLVPGYFEDTLPRFVAEHPGARLGFVHIDCDIYSSTRTIFRECGEMFRPGCVVVFDELLHYGGFLENEMRAFHEFLSESGRDFEWLATRGRVMDLDTFLERRDRGELPSEMKRWRELGFEQEVAVRML